MVASDEVRAVERRTLSLRLEQWPRADCEAWVAACQPAARLKRGGTASHLQPVTRDDHAAHYGNFLVFLNRRGLLRRDGPPAVNVTLEYVDAYLNERKNQLASTTLHSTICKLRRTAQYIAPSRDFAWLAEIGKDLALLACPRSKVRPLSRGRGSSRSRPDLNP
jgi:hypothetical protein